jgi:hypothetical protein
MTVTHKERKRPALRREPVDRIPTQVNYTRAMRQPLAARLGVIPDALPQQMDNHLLRLDLTYEDRRSEDGQIAFDWWGVGFDTRQEGHFDTVHPLANTDPENLDGLLAALIAPQHPRPVGQLTRPANYAILQRRSVNGNGNGNGAISEQTIGHSARSSRGCEGCCCKPSESSWSL